MKKCLILIKSGECSNDGQITKEGRKHMRTFGERIQPHLGDYARQTLACPAGKFGTASGIVLLSALKLDCFFACSELWVDGEHPRDDARAFAVLREKYMNADALITVVHSSYLATLPNTFYKEVFGSNIDSLDQYEIANSQGVFISDDQTKPHLTIF